MELQNGLANLSLNNNDELKYEYIDVFKNPNNLPINQIHLQKTWVTLRKDLPQGLEVCEVSDEDLQKKFCETKTEIIPALDKRWLSKSVIYRFEPYIFTLSEEENVSFLTSNLQFLESLEYLLNCNFHQFWCTVLFESQAVLALRSFLLNPIPWYQVSYLEHEYQSLYKAVFKKFLLVYERLLTFRVSKKEFMLPEVGMKYLIERKLINLPIVITLAFLYKNSNIDFVNKVTSTYFDDTSQLDFQIKEVEESIKQSNVILEMVYGNVCGFSEGIPIVPVSIEKRPAMFSLSWIYSIVNYLLNTVTTLNVLLQFYKPAVEIALNISLPFRIPSTYVNVYKEIYEMLEDREEITTHIELCQRVLDEINMGRSEFIDVYHIFISHCLDKTLENMGDSKSQEHFVELYLKLLSTAIEDEYFICDYNVKHDIQNQNEMFESCCSVDSTRTEFFSSCVKQLSRQKKLEEFSKLNKRTIVEVFKEFKPLVVEKQVEYEPEPRSSTQNAGTEEEEIEEKIKYISEMFGHLGDGFILQCLEAYNYNSTDVINAILEENLPPHLYEIPFDTIRIPPEPEPEKPVVAYIGKKPDYDDALKLLNDKKDMKEIKTFVLEGVQYSTDYMYDDEYDDRYDDVPIRVVDNPLSEELPTFNPNHEDAASDASSSDEQEDQSKNCKTENTTASSSRNKLNFCEDPAVLRERREAKYRSHNPPSNKGNVVGNAKGQGQDKSVLLSRQRKGVNKSSRANHNRKGGAQWKRSKGMF